MKITKNGDDIYTYERKVKERSWDDKMYFFPIPQSEKSKNPNLEQNPVGNLTGILMNRNRIFLHRTDVYRIKNERNEDTLYNIGAVLFAGYSCLLR